MKGLAEGHLCLAFAHLRVNPVVLPRLHGWVLVRGDRVPVGEVGFKVRRGLLAGDCGEALSRGGARGHRCAQVEIPKQQLPPLVESGGAHGRRPDVRRFRRATARELSQPWLPVGRDRPVCDAPEIVQPALG
jgi:hypothetical protein